MAHQNSTQETLYDGRFHVWLDELRRRPKVYTTYEELLAAQAGDELPDVDGHVDETFAAPEPFQFDDDFRYYPVLLPALKLDAGQSNGDQSAPLQTPADANVDAESSASDTAPQDHGTNALLPAASMKEGDLSTTKPRKVGTPPQDDCEDAAGPTRQGEASMDDMPDPADEDREQSASSAPAGARTSAEDRNGERAPPLLDLEILLGLRTDSPGGSQTTPELSSTRSDSRSESRTSDLQTPGSDLDLDALLSGALGHGDDGTAAALLDTSMLEDEQSDHGDDTVGIDESPLPLYGDSGDACVAALLQNALQGDEAASAALFEIIKLAGAQKDDAQHKISLNDTSALAGDAQVARACRSSIEATFGEPQTMGPGPQHERVLSLTDKNKGKRQETAPKNRGRPATREAGSIRCPTGGPKTVTHSRPAWRGPSPSQASSSATTSAQPPASEAPLLTAAPLNDIGWQEEGGASRVIKEYRRLQQSHIDQTEKAILALPPHATPSQLPPRRYRTASERASIRSVGQAMSIERRASLADPRFEACEKCEIDYGLKNEPIRKGRMEPHTAEYHKGRMCSVCGLPVSGRETESSVKHRKDCLPWQAMVTKDFYKAWLRTRGFYGHDESEREFWKNYQRARAKKLAHGNEELRIQLLEQELENGEVQALRALIPRSQTQTPATGSTGYTQQQTAATPRQTGTVAQHPGNESTVYPGPAQRVLHPSKANVAQHWIATSHQSQTLSGPQASTSLPPPTGQWVRSQPAAPMLYHRGLQAPGHRGQPNAFGSVYHPRGAPYPYDVRSFNDDARNQVGAADQVRREPASANTVADSARSFDVAAVPSTERSSHPANDGVSNDAKSTECYDGSWDDDEDDLYS